MSGKERRERIEQARMLGSLVGERPLKEILDQLSTIVGDDEELQEAFTEAVEKAVAKQEMINKLKITPPKKKG